MSWMLRCPTCAAGFAQQSDLERHKCPGRLRAPADAERDERERDWWHWWEEKRQQRW